MQLRQLQSVAHTLQLVEAHIRRDAAKRKAQNEGWRPPSWDNQRGISNDHIAGFVAARTAVQLIAGAGDAVLGSLQGQLLLQSCTSVLLTCDGIVQNKQHDASPASLALCVRLLQLLQRAEPLAAADSSTCGMSQSLAAGSVLAGRCLIAVLTQLYPASFIIEEHCASMDSWLSHCDFLTPAEGSLSFQNFRNVSKEDERAQASILQQAMLDLLSCVQSTKQALQQQVAAASMSDSDCPAGTSSSRSASCSSSSTSTD
jgi:hypothetical protein